MGGTNVSKFTVSEFGIVFNVRGNAQKALRQMAKDVDRLHGKISRLNKISGGGGFGAAGGGLAGGGGRRGAGSGGRKPGGGGATPDFDFGSAGARSFATGLDLVALNARYVSDAMFTMASAIVGPVVDAFEQGIARATSLEAAMTNLEFVANKNFGENYASTISAKVEEIGLRTNQTTDAVRALASSLIMREMDPFAEGLDNLAVRGGGVTSAMEAIADASILAKGGMYQLSRGIGDVVSEGALKRNRGLVRSLDIGVEVMKAWNKEIKKGGSNQERFNILMGLMAEKFGGVAQAQGNLLAFVMNQWDDIYDKIVTVMFIESEVTQMFADSLKEVQTYLLDIATDAEKLKALRQTMRDLAQVVLTLGGLLAGVLKFMLEFTIAHPGVIKVALALGAAAAAAAVFVGALAVVLGIAGSLFAMWSFAGPMLVAAFVAAGPVIAIVAVKLAAILAIMIGLSRYFVGGKDWVDTWDRLKTVMTGVWQMLTNMNEAGNTFITEAVGMKLAEMGLLEPAIKVAKLLYNAWSAIKGMGQGIKDGVLPFWNELTAIVGQTFRTIGNILGLFFELKGLGILFSTSTEASASSWETMGYWIGRFLTLGLTVISYFLKAGVAVLKVINFALEVIRPFVEWLMDKVQWLIDQALILADKFDIGSKLENLGQQTGITPFLQSVGGFFSAEEGGAIDKMIEAINDPTEVVKSIREGLEPSMVAESGRIDSAKRMEKSVQGGSSFRDLQYKQAMDALLIGNISKALKYGLENVSLKLNAREVNEGLAETVQEAYAGGT